MLREAIRSFPSQFSFRPIVENAGRLRPAAKFVVAAMGGSNHATDLLKAWQPAADVVVHRDYGLPAVPDLAERLTVACSYSGNTEEPIDSFEQALARSLPLAAVATGAKLLAAARAAGVPYIVIPDTGLEPRSATGFMFVALLKLMGDEPGLAAAAELSAVLAPATLEAPGRALAERLAGAVPVVYASTRNAAVANNWKIKLNENVKIPAFMNVIPELNHNEMDGFDPQPGTRALSQPFRFVFLQDDEDHPRVVRRMQVLADLYRARGLAVEFVPLAGRSRLEKIFSSLLLADWVTLALAERYGVDPEPVPMVEEFKRLLAP